MPKTWAEEEIVEENIPLGRNISLTLGNLTPQANSVAINEQGQKNNFEFNPYLGAFYRHRLNEQWALYPELGITYPDNGRDDTITKVISFLRSDLGYQFPQFSFLVWRVGYSLFFTYIKGKGGLKTIRNGSSYSSFFVPNQSSTSISSTLDFGPEFLISHFDAEIPLSIKAQVHVHSLFASLSRQYSYSVSLNFSLQNFFQDKYK